MNPNSLFLDGTENLSIPTSTVIPVLLYPNVPAAAAWLCRAFGFEERLRIGTHRIQLTVGSGAVVVAEAPPGATAFGSGHSIMVRVRDADAHCARAKAAGAKVLAEPVTHVYGERQYSVGDLVGRVWVFSESFQNTHPSTWGGQLAT